MDTGSDGDNVLAHLTEPAALQQQPANKEKDIEAGPVYEPQQQLERPQQELNRQEPPPPILQNDHPQQQSPANVDEETSTEKQKEEEQAGPLPPELSTPPGKCRPELQDRVAQWLHIQNSQGRYLSDRLRTSRDYRNPEFFRKMVEYWEINEHGTSFNPEVFDPSSLPKEDTLEALQKEWLVEEQRRRTARATTGKIEFTKGGVINQPAAAGGGASSAAAAAIAAAHAKAAALAAAHARR